MGHHYWPVGQAVKTPPFHGGIGGSIPPPVTIRALSSAGRASALQAECQRFDPVSAHHVNLALHFCEVLFLFPIHATNKFPLPKNKVYAIISM